jgi:hypothetical protein
MSWRKICCAWSKTLENQIIDSPMSSAAPPRSTFFHGPYPWILALFPAEKLSVSLLPATISNESQLEVHLEGGTADQMISGPRICMNLMTNPASCASACSSFMKTGLQHSNPSKIQAELWNPPADLQSEALSVFVATNRLLKPLLPQREKMLTYRRIFAAGTARCLSSPFVRQTVSELRENPPHRHDI